MKDYVTESSHKLSIAYEPDVLIAGGGIAGVAAALAAARNGATVLLAEKQCMVGGLATSGLVAEYLPLCDGMGHQVCFGIAEELLRLSLESGAKQPIPTVWLQDVPGEGRKKMRYRVQFNPHHFALLLEQRLLREKVRILYDTRICAASCRNQRVEYLVAENRSGRFAIKAKTYVDATGDALLYELAGLPVRTFSKGNILAGWYYSFDGKKVDLRPLGFAEVFDGSKQENVRPLSDRRFSGTDGEDITDFLLLSHEAVLEDIRKRKEFGENPDLELTTIAGMPQLRMIRCIEGEYCLKETENEVCFPDSIGMTGDWRKSGMRYEIPYRTLYNSALRNAICAGRCISVDDGMWDISRVIPPCAVTGEAAGTAAALAEDFHTLSYDKLAERLEAQGQKLKISQVSTDSAQLS